MGETPNSLNSEGFKRIVKKIIWKTGNHHCNFGILNAEEMCYAFGFFVVWMSSHFLLIRIQLFSLSWGKLIICSCPESAGPGRSYGTSCSFLAFLFFWSLSHCCCCSNSFIFLILSCTLPTSPSSFPPTNIIESTVTFDHVKVKLYPVATASCLSLQLPIPSAMYLHPPFHWKYVQLTQTGTDIGASATTAGWSVISGVPDQIAPFTFCMKSHRQWQKEGQRVWGVRYQKVFK